MNKTKPVKTKNTFGTFDLVYSALGAVLIALCSWVSIPTNVPFTMQTFAVFCVLSILGGRCGTISIIVYIILAAIGVPVLAGFASGMGVVLGNTGGYIVGFIFIGLIYWLATGLLGKKLWVEIVAMVVGIIMLYVFGTAWFMIVYARTDEPIGLAMALSWCVLPFIIPDLIKLGLALMLSRRIPALPNH